MGGTREYQTRQRQILLGCLERYPDRQYTVDQLLEQLAKQGEQIGRTTVYRALARLEEQGLVRKYPAASGRSAAFQFLSPGGECNAHIHLKCTGCDKLIHFHCGELEAFEAHVEETHGFQISTRTILYGQCSACAGKKKEEEGTDLDGVDNQSEFEN